MAKTSILRLALLIFCCSVAVPLSTGRAEAKRAYKTLYAFSGIPDGSVPMATLITDAAGNLYGTTEQGGSSGGGTVFKVTRTGVESVFHSFGPENGTADGSSPQSGVIADTDGNLYGTTYYGGGGCPGVGCGIVYKISPDGTETILHKFKEKTDGHLPVGGLLADENRNLYGTTALGGTGCGKPGCGTVFRISPDGSETVLYSFKGGSDGSIPYAGLIADSSGNLYGTTTGAFSGCGQLGCGTVFKLSPDGTETVLYSFKGKNDGAVPYAHLIVDSKGNFYGTTSQGGGSGCGGVGCGTVFKLTPDGTETILHAFQGGSDGAVPYAPLIMDKNGNLFGTTQQGSHSDKRGCFQPFGCGTVFEIAPDGTETILVAFVPKHPQLPYGGLTAGSQGQLYGTTEESVSRGSPTGGIVFELKSP